MPPMATPPRFSDALGHGMSDKRIDILRGIGRSGSISQAGREAGVSYKAAWQAIDTLTNLAGVPLVARAVGGAGGGGATLTPHGAQLLALAEALDAARQAVHRRWSAETAGAAGAGAGPAGVAGASAANPGAALAMTRLALRTSMRNQLPAHIERIDLQGRIARVVMQLGQSGRIAARVTEESVQLLGLAAGMPVIALCKATAVRVALAAAGTRAPRGNHLSGSVRGVARGETGDEITLALAPGLQIVGFAPPGAVARARQRVTAAVDESALVVALAG